MVAALSLLPVTAPQSRSRTAYIVVIALISIAVLTQFTNYAPLQQFGYQVVAYATIAVAAFAVGKTLYIIVHARVVTPLPRSKMAGGGMTFTMETVAGFVIGILVVGIILGVFILLSNMEFEINGTRYRLIPSPIAALTQSTTLTLISIIVIIAIIVILIPVVKYLLDLFGGKGNR